MKTARISRLYWMALAVALAAAIAWGASDAPQANEPVPAQNQYQRAQKLEAALEVKPGGSRTETDYLKVIQAYRRVEQLSPAPLLAAPSLVAIGRLYDEMGHMFDTSYFQKALGTYRYLLQQYPRSMEAPETLYSIAELEKGPLADPASARKSLDSLIALYPSSDPADRARLELAQAGQTSEAVSTHSVSNGPAISNRENNRAADSAPGTGAVAGGIEGSRPAVVRAVATKETPGTTRIVVYLNGPVKFRSARIAHPDRVYFDLSRAYLIHPHGMRLTPDSAFVNSVYVAQNQPHVVRLVLDLRPDVAYSASLLRHPYRLAIDVDERGKADHDSLNASRETAEPAAADATTPGEQVADSDEAPATTEDELLTKGNLTPAQPTHSGTTSLTRALGLKIDRIVIDPGHGGFDTGAIGPSGLEEKTVCLAIARQLGRLIRRRLPETQVIYTRDSDRFVPLEERTQIANEKKADLFISIHANSSTDPAARGVEVYYLNFTTSPEAIAVAARENALAQVPVHRLQSLLKQISLNDKIEESRDLAGDVDHSLVHELRLGHVQMDDRGVKKAPFVVLIGAHMPSILVEVSFLSNPTDDQLLGEARYRQRIAVGLFDGIRGYLAGLNSLSFNQAQSSPATSADKH